MSLSFSGGTGSLIPLKRGSLSSITTLSAAGIISFAGLGAFKQYFLDLHYKNVPSGANGQIILRKNAANVVSGYSHSYVVSGSTAVTAGSTTGIVFGNGLGAIHEIKVNMLLKNLNINAVTDAGFEYNDLVFRNTSSISPTYRRGGGGVTAASAANAYDGVNVSVSSGSGATVDYALFGLN